MWYGVSYYPEHKDKEEIIKDIDRQCDWALDGYKVEKDFNKVHSTLMKAVTKRVAIKMGVVTLTNKITN